MSTIPTSFLPYHEPGIVTILIQSSFLFVLNIVSTVFDKLIFCGLLGQVFIGVAWGTPAGQLLSQDVEGVVVQLGYLGLILLVYEGGLGTNFRSLKANIYLSIAVALTGIAMPMALSFILLSLVNATLLQAFAAGAALCSTSLGTTFTILGTSGLSATRLGTVLTSAAMMDDVVGLVMVQVISNLGLSSSSFSAVTVVRPLAVSVGFVVAVPLVCRFVVLPLTLWLNGMREGKREGFVERLCHGTHTAFIIHTLILTGMVTGATYAGTSNLFAAYLAGASISWWDSEVPHPSLPSESATAKPSASKIQPGQSDSVIVSSQQRAVEESRPEPSEVLQEACHRDSHEADESTGAAVHHKYFSIPLARILKPFFFASIGFAIPITEMFSGEIVWRGILYTILMLFAKLVTGLWLIRMPLPQLNLSLPRRRLSSLPASCFSWGSGKGKANGKERARSTSNQVRSHDSRVNLEPEGNDNQDSTNKNTTGEAVNHQSSETPTPKPDSTSQQTQTPTSNTKKINKPLSLYPASMLGTAMTARGEIGFLIASLAETTGLFTSSTSISTQTATGSSEIYLVVTWAIVLCTIIGPLSVGTLVKRVRRLQAEREKNPGKADPLGSWGVG